VPSTKRPVNPFYVLLVLAGIAFTVTACAYGVMAFRAVRTADPPTGLPAFLDRHGGMLMVAELAVLAVATLAAIALDHRRGRMRSPNDEGRTPKSE
jgi:hypothetical protein